MNLFTVFGSLFFNDEKLEDIKPFVSEFREDITISETRLSSQHTMAKRAIITKTNFSGYPSHNLSGYSTRPIMGMLDE